MSEIDNFIWKFKNLLYAGKHAKLTIESKTGKAFVSLFVEVDVPFSPPKSSRNGPSRQHRRVRRAEEHAAAGDVTNLQVGCSLFVEAVEQSTEAITNETTVLYSRRDTYSCMISFFLPY